MIDLTFSIFASTRRLIISVLCRMIERFILQAVTCSRASEMKVIDNGTINSSALVCLDLCATVIIHFKQHIAGVPFKYDYHFCGHPREEHSEYHDGLPTR